MTISLTKSITDIIDITIDIIKTLNGHTNLHCFSNCYSTEEYNQTTQFLSPAIKPCLNNVHLNIRSLQKNTDNLPSFLERFCSRPWCTHHCLTEIWPKDSTKHLYHVDSYYLYHSCRLNRVHGGVSLLISTDIKSEPV